MRRRIQRQEISDFGSVGRVAAVVTQHPREFVGGVMASAAVFAIFVNAMFLQHGPHPAPIFAPRPLLTQEAPVVAPRAPVSQTAMAPDTIAPSRAQLIANIQRELGRKGFYDGGSDGVWGVKTDAATRDFLLASGAKVNPEASDSLLRAIVAYAAKAPASRTASVEPVRNDPIAELIAPSKRVLAIQRALADFGYGQIKPSGSFDPETRTAIEKFERDRKLPVTGQISDRFVRELAAMTGRPLE